MYKLRISGCNTTKWYKMSAKVTIGLCVKNSEKTIRDSIDSIIGQKYPSELIQLVIVDGCSKDKTMPIIASAIAETGVRVETYSDEGKGLGAARQIVVNNANGKYVIFVDADVIIFDDFVRRHVDFMAENSNVGVAFGKPMFQEGTLVSTVWSLYCYINGGFLGNDATIYRPEAIKEVHGFDLNIKGAGEDVDLIDKIRVKGWLVSTNEKARFFHKSRDTLREFSTERIWFGYGGHYLYHKNRIAQPLWHDLPIGALRYGLKMAFKAYRLTQRKISFLIPLQLIFGNVSWWVGFIKGHLYGFGHGKSS